MKLKGIVLLKLLLTQLQNISITDINAGIRKQLTPVGETINKTANRMEPPKWKTDLKL